jgi:hypothetical protein
MRARVARGYAGRVAVSAVGLSALPVINIDLPLTAIASLTATGNWSLTVAPAPLERQL